MKVFITFGLLFALVFAASAVPASKEQLDDVAEGTHDEVKRQERQLYQGQLYQGAESYAAPSYAKPEKAKEGHKEHGAPAVYTYHVPAPTVPCAKSVLVGCAPSVVPVPCAPHKGHGY